MKYRKGIKIFLSLSGWKQFLKILTKKEKIIFFIFLCLIISSFIFLSFNFYFKNTEEKPARGGVHIEGLVGSPLRINPVYYQENDVDRDLAELIYSGLMKYNEKGEIVPDLAEEYKVIENGKVFEFYLKENLVWSDGTLLTADDIIFTVKSIQNPALKSPIRASWLGIEIEKISDIGVRFKLRSPSAVFLENSVLKIMPKHIWQDISEQNFPFSQYNLNPIGSGPYKIKEIRRNQEDNITSLELAKNSNYHRQKPHIPKIIFLFFKNESELISAFNANRIKGFSLISSEKYENVKQKNLSEYNFLMPRYFSVFINSKEKELSDKKIRQALNYATDKKEIISQILSVQGKIIDSPILPDIFGFESPSKIYEFNPEKAKEILEQAGFIEQENGFREKIVKKEPAFKIRTNLESGSKGAEVEELQKCLAKDPDVYPEAEITGYFGDKTKTAVIKFQEKYKEEILVPQGLSSGTGRVMGSTREKLNELCFSSSEQTFPVSFSLTTVIQPDMIKIASQLQKDWQAIGVKLEIEILDVSEIKEKIRLRNYEMLLFGQILGIFPDPFPFWHSSQVKDPGLNLTNYENKEADKLLEQARQIIETEERKEKLEKFQNILIEDAPAIFLYSPDYLYLTSKEIKGISQKTIIDPSKRFIDIENWHIKTKRTWK